MSQQVSPRKMAIDEWLAKVNHQAHIAAFRDAWLRLKDLSSADLELQPEHHGQQNDWLVLGLSICSFGQTSGRFRCAIRNARHAQEAPVVIATPRFSNDMPDELCAATLQSLYLLAPQGAELEVVLEDRTEAVVSTLAEAGRYTDAGWTLNPKRTELISDSPRLWIFRFLK